jgi:NOL1/NOP2/fmu family ribosome biogenesis protein
LEPFVYSLRYNLKKSNPIIFDKIAWEQNATYIEKQEFILEPAWHAGCYYVQESSSMFLGHILEQIKIKDKNIIALDACAAPGGKSTHLLDKLNENSILIANELIPKRNAILKENIIRWGNANTIITQSETKYFENLKNFFDLVLVDAPCSGEGLFKKKPDARNEWSQEHVVKCAIRQREILQHLIPVVKENGYLIYSTCTFQESENEEQIRFLLENGFELVEIDVTHFNEISIGKIENTFRFELEKVKGSGFFIACLQKKTQQQINSACIYYNINNKIEKYKFNFLDNWVGNSDTYNCYTFKNLLYAFPIQFSPVLDRIKNNLYITYFGVELGELKKEIFIPAHALALSIVVSKQIPNINVDKEVAIQFLKKQDIALDSIDDKNEVKLGWNLIQYKNNNLGWIKILQHRINNYLPNHWRILKR